MMTVLPTPAPPNRPILPPFTNGAIRSMTLMPVSNTSVLGSRSTNFGVSRWMGHRSAVDGMGSPSSTGVLLCRFLLRGRLVGSVLGGRGPGVGASGGASLPPEPRALAPQGFRSTHDLRQLLRDLRLARPVEGALQQVEHLPRVVGGVLHRGALRAQERRRRLHQRAIHLIPHVQRQQLLEDRLGGGLQDVVPRPRPPSTALHRPGWGNGEDAECGRWGRDRALELGEYYVHGVHGARFELCHERRDDLRGLGRGRLVSDVDPLRRHGSFRELEVRDALLADEVQIDRRALRFELLDAPPRFADQVRVECPTQSPVGGDQNKCRPFPGLAPGVSYPGLAQQREPLRQLRGVQVGDHLREGGGIGPRRDHPVLGAFELGRGHQLHRLGDLAGALDGLDPPAQLAGLRHQSAAICLYSAMAARSRAASSSPSTLRARISSPMSRCWAAMKSRKPCSQPLIAATATSSRKPLVTAKMIMICCSTGMGAYCGCFSTSTTRAPRASCFCVASSSSEPNWANASSSRYCARSRRRRPATCFIALICALPPTRDTEMPGLIAGRTFEKNMSVSRKIWPSVIEMTFVGM